MPAGTRGAVSVRWARGPGLSWPCREAPWLWEPEAGSHALPVRLLPLQGKELLAQKLPLWQQACADPNKIPDRAVQLMQQMGNSNGSILPSGLSASKSNLVISDPIPGAKPLPVPPELAPFVGVSPCCGKFCGCGEGGSPRCRWLAPWGSLTGGLAGPRPPCHATPTPPLLDSGCLPRRTHPS